MKRYIGGDFFGAFADAAVLFPLLTLLHQRIGFESHLLLISVALAYLAAGFIFHLPMPVQPLKSIAIVAISIGASKSEVQLSGFLLGLYCLGLCLFNVNRLAQLTPTSLIQTIQFSLGLLLIDQAFSRGAENEDLIIGLVIMLVFIFLGQRSKIPFLGIFAVAVFSLSLSFALSNQEMTNLPSSLRWDVVVGLVLPQMVLTLSNSVLGTASAARAYFGERSQRITIKKLLLSIGLGNIVVTFLQGMPFCHGAGGLTAHVKGGAHSCRMNLIIGSILLALGLWAMIHKTTINFNFPHFALTALLGTVGFHHLGLAREMLKNKPGTIELLVGAIIVLITKNLLWVFCWCLLFEFVVRKNYPILKT
jgi:sulfate permease, SulP family